LQFTSAPFFNNNWTTFSWPFIAAQCSGVCNHFYLVVRKIEFEGRERKKKKERKSNINTYILQTSKVKNKNKNKNR
jgi:hypothetical protein